MSDEEVLNERDLSQADCVFLNQLLLRERLPKYLLLFVELGTLAALCVEAINPRVGDIPAGFFIFLQAGFAVVGQVLCLTQTAEKVWGDEP